MEGVFGEWKYDDDGDDDEDNADGNDDVYILVLWLTWSEPSDGTMGGRIA